MSPFSHILLLATYVLSVGSLISATPVPIPQTGGGSRSCPAEPLTADTWNSLDVDTFLSEWSAANVTETTTNNIQSLANSFGSPNFFCGLDNFCNAGQPCLPVELPAWYAMVAIQNWNSYMNSMNTAINFASSIMSLTLPGIVQDFYPKPQDDITPLTNIVKVFTTALSLVPFTGPVSSAAGNVNKGLLFLTGQLTPPEEPDLFVSWSNIATSLSKVVENYQSAVSTTIKRVIDAPVGSDNGINNILKGGEFLGISQNFTQTEIQSAIIDSIRVRAIALTLQAQKTFVSRISNSPNCKEDDASLCVDNGSGGHTKILLVRRSGKANAGNMSKEGKLLAEKYGISKEQFLLDTGACFDENDKQQLVDPFGDSLPLDSKSRCLFNLIVCDKSATDGVGIVDQCKNAGNDV